MTSHHQVLTTTIISTLVITLALQLSDQKSIIIEYYNSLFRFLSTENVWDQILVKGGKAPILLAQFGALVLLRKLYTDIISPLHMILSTYQSVSNLKDIYGSWGVIAGDLDLGDKTLMREFAKDFIKKGMNVLILDCSLDGQKKNKQEENIRNEVVNLFIEDLKQFGSDDINDGRNGSSNNIVATKTKNSHQTNGVYQKVNSNNNIPQVDIITVKESTLPQFRSQITSKLGDIAQSGGIGILVHCFSSIQATNTKFATEANNYSPSYGKSGTEQFFVTILNLTLPYMTFRGTGAIINVSQYDTVADNEAVPARGYAECAFYTQLIRSLHYEYEEHGIDCLAVTIPSTKKNFDADTIILSSLQILGEESELDLKICTYIDILKHFLEF